MTHNYVADATQYPTHMRILSYHDQKAFKDRYKKTDAERAELFALKIAYEFAMKEEYGKNWKKKVNQLSRRPQAFAKTIWSNTRPIAQWN